MNKHLKIPLILLAVWVAGCSASSKENAISKESTVKVLPVTRLVEKSTDLHREYVGDIHAIRNVDIYARVKGYLEQVYVDEGRYVRKGQILFRINNEEYKAKLASAKANLQSTIAEAKAAQLEVNRVKLLVDKKVISKTELEVAQARYAAVEARIMEARSELANATLRLSHTSIKAPFSGIINRLPYKVGSLINEGTLLTSVSDIGSVYVYFDVSEGEYLEYVKANRLNSDKKNREVELVLADGSRFSHMGKVETMEGEFDEGTGSIAFRARFPNPGKLLKHGSSGKVRLTNTISNALLVPQKAVFEIQDKNYVYIVDKNKQVKMKSFQPKTRIAQYYVVESGLEPGDEIVYEGIQNIKDGVKIQPKYVSMDSISAGSEEVRLSVK
ncbi:efflux RND transporter periplasmic adaptor subunit [Telluribacter sp.]|jgi:membrane fusion protein (multidrug efflux system)|uniref:efflux RND transporter periplasmic adaptor subunit n=1 Tax=Telluribacter sp. TaxID=1978767 RepID=UPI002E10E7FB|nr:efflux RND transporter periplasmic adaptor subunit [Telluribacter sp.]